VRRAWVVLGPAVQILCLRISVSNAGYTVFRGSVKGTGYPLLSPVSPSLPLPCVTLCHHVSTGVYHAARLPNHFCPGQATVCFSELIVTINNNKLYCCPWKRNNGLLSSYKIILTVANGIYYLSLQIKCLLF